MRRAIVVAVVVVTSVVAVAPAGAEAGFGDVWPGRYYTDAVQWMVDEGITGGVTPECFRPEQVVTRGQAAAFLWRMEEHPSPSWPHEFVDVVQPWQQDPVAWMVENGITLGVTDSTFEPERAVNRAEFAVLLWRLAGRPMAPPSTAFDDVPATAFFADAVAWMVAGEITSGTSATMFSPGARITRAEAATFLHRYAGSPDVTVDPTRALCPIEYQPGVTLQVFEPASCPTDGNRVVMTGGPNSFTFRDRFAPLGYVHVDVDYRNPGYSGRLDAGTLRAFGWSVSDLATAVRWVRAHAADLCADPDRIAAAGYSYGAITALSLAYTLGELTPGEVIVADGVGDPTVVGDEMPPPPPAWLEPYSPDIQAAVSFAGFALAHTIDPGEPPALLFHGTNDSTIPYPLAQQTCAAATAVGITCELVTHNAGHAATDAVGNFDDAINRTDAFLRRELG